MSIKDLYLKKDRLDDEIYQVTRNIVLNEGDINLNGVLTQQFFERNDISSQKIKILVKLTSQLKDVNDEIFKLS